MSKSSKSKKTSVTPVVQEPTIQNGINMNLTHADVIEVAIQTQLEILEPQLEKLEHSYTECKKQLEEIQSRIITKALEKVGSSPIGKQFLNVVKAVAEALDVPVPEYQITSKSFGGTQENLSSREVDVNECSNVEEYKNPLGQFKRYARKRTLQWNISDVVYFNLSASFGNVGVNTQRQECQVRLTESDMNNWRKMTQAILDTQANICEQMFDIQKQILELKYDEKKVKARVVKMSLSKTEQGRNILGLLESATKIKLLD